MSNIIRTAPIWLPFGMAAMAMALVLGYLAMHGLNGVSQADVGRTASLFQWLIILQIPLMLYMAASHKYPIKSALIIVACQLAASLGAAVLVLWLESLK